MLVAPSLDIIQLTPLLDMGLDVPILARCKECDIHIDGLRHSQDSLAKVKGLGLIGKVMCLVIILPCISV